MSFNIFPEISFLLVLSSICLISLPIFLILCPFPADSLTSFSTHDAILNYLNSMLLTYNHLGYKLQLKKLYKRIVLVMAVVLFESSVNLSLLFLQKMVRWTLPRSWTYSMNTARRKMSRQKFYKLSKPMILTRKAMSQLKNFDTFLQTLETDSPIKKVHLFTSITFDQYLMHNYK